MIKKYGTFPISHKLQILYILFLPLFRLNVIGHRNILDQRVRTRKCNIHPSQSCNYIRRQDKMNGVLVDVVSGIDL